MVSRLSSPTKTTKQQVFAARCPRVRVSNLAAAQMGEKGLAGVKKLIRKDRNERYKLKNKQELILKRLAASLLKNQKKDFFGDLKSVCGAGHVLRAFGGMTGFDMAVMA